MYPCPYRLKNLENAHTDLVMPTYFEGKYSSTNPHFLRMYI